jgi:hypothetical protein
MAEPTALSVPDLVLSGIVVVLPLVVLFAVTTIPRLVRAVARRLHPPELTAHGPPIEQLAADLRRVHRVLRHLPPGTTIVRWRATWHAYDTLLMQACEAVGVRHGLDQLPPAGFERELERLRVEEDLRQAGLAV